MTVFKNEGNHFEISRMSASVELKALTLSLASHGTPLMPVQRHVNQLPQKTTTRLGFLHAALPQQASKRFLFRA
uniref:Uncharacterized protein n=1 Tax=Anguilla anguilla TaxID=7936 RepID=A0A0E9WH51_ANGAN